MVRREKEGRREGGGINRRALSEKLPDCKIHSALAFETLTARKNAPEWDKRERSRGVRSDRIEGEREREREGGSLISERRNRAMLFRASLLPIVDATYGM